MSKNTSIFYHLMDSNHSYQPDCTCIIKIIPKVFSKTQVIVTGIALAMHFLLMVILCCLKRNSDSDSKRCYFTKKNLSCIHFITLILILMYLMFTAMVCMLFCKLFQSGIKDILDILIGILDMSIMQSFKSIQRLEMHNKQLAAIDLGTQFWRFLSEISGAMMRI